MRRNWTSSCFGARLPELTDAGRVFLDHALATIANFDGAFEATRRAAHGEQGRVRVGVMPTAPFHPFVPFSIRAFRTAFPLVALTWDECLNKEALERLRNGQMDVPSMRAGLERSRGLLNTPLLVEPMVAANPNDHPLAKRGDAGAPIALKELAGETFVVYARQLGPALYQSTIAARLWKTVRQTSSAFSVLKKVSTMALSKQFPLPNIDIRMPCRRSSAWYAFAQYWPPRSAW